ncbi:BrnT family toxin [Zooshikella sp. RANM57]|uniref:BrnT family toxin n=1 Tax=Zooshikella sp. RANM57 TaxID=3425863 RepID=UPI003D6DBF42
MKFIWDKNKNASNQRKHGLSFELALRVFSDPHQLSIQDRYVDGEERWQTTGEICGVAIVLVAHTIKEDEGGEEIVRIISARRAEKHEIRCYEQEKYRF